MRPNHPLHLVLGPTIWASWFATLYASLSVVCNLTPPPANQGATTWINASLLILTLPVSLLLMTLGYRCWRHASASFTMTRDRSFISKVAAGVYLLTALSTLLLGLPLVLLPPCI